MLLELLVLVVSPSGLAAALMLAFSASMRSTTLADRLGAFLQHDLVTLALLLNDRFDLLAVGVVEALGVPLALHRLNEQLGHRELAVGHVAGLGQVEVASGGAHLVGEVHGVQGEASSSGRMATRYSLLRMTSVAMATRPASDMARRRRA